MKGKKKSENQVEDVVVVKIIALVTLKDPNRENMVVTNITLATVEKA